MSSGEDKVRFFQSLKTNSLFTSRIFINGVYITFRKIDDYLVYSFNYATIASIKTPAGLFIYNNTNDNQRLRDHINSVLANYSITEPVLTTEYNKIPVIYSLLSESSITELSADPVIQSIIKAESYGVDLAKLNLDVQSHRNYLAIILNFIYNITDTTTTTTVITPEIPDDAVELIDMYKTMMEKKYGPR